MTVEQLKAQRRAQKSSLSVYKNRRSEVNDIIRKIDNNLTTMITSINLQTYQCSSKLREGLKGSSKIATICDDIENQKEKDIHLDDKISSCRSSLSSEANRCQAKIDTINSQIKWLENQIEAQGGVIYFWE